MEYTQFIIRNFKGIQEIHIDLDRSPRSPVFSLVGLNESGKTTILEAIHWLYDDSRINPEDLIPKSMLANFNGDISVEAKLRLSKEDQEKVGNFLWKKFYKFELETQINNISVKRIYSYIDSQKESGYLEWVIPLKGKSSRAKQVRKYQEGEKYWEQLKTFIESRFYPPIIYYENFLFDFPEKIYLKPKEGAELSPLDTRYKAVIQDVLTSVKKSLDVDKHLVKRYILGIKRPLEAALNSISSKVSKEVFDIWQELLKFEETSGMEISFGQDLKDDDKHL
jgi:hypothetical protein